MLLVRAQEDLPYPVNLEYHVTYLNLNLYQ
jgi:hypothetical protein